MPKAWGTRWGLALGECGQQHSSTTVVMYLIFSLLMAEALPPFFLLGFPLMTEHLLSIRLATETDTAIMYKCLA